MTKACARAHSEVLDSMCVESPWGLAFLGLAFLGLAFLGLAFLGLAFLGLAFLGLAFLGLARPILGLGARLSR